LPLLLVLVHLLLLLFCWHAHKHQPLVKPLGIVISLFAGRIFCAAVALVAAVRVAVNFLLK
jgi:hypothetical protein